MKRSKRALALFVSSLLVLASVQAGCATEAPQAETQSWDPSVKALTQFPSVLAMMDKSLSWTSSLGDAYVNGQQNVLDAVQVMRQRAQQAGNLKSTQQQTVTTQGQTIVIEPTDPEVV